MALRDVCTKFISRSGFAAIASVLALTTGAVGVVSVAQTQPVAAASCTVQDDFPDTNIIYCGLSGGSNVSQLVSSLKTYYNNNDDGHGHTDLQAAYNATGLSSGMFTSGSWHLGTSFDNDTIVVDNNIVGTNVHISSRCFSGMTNCQPADKYTHLKDKNGNTVSNVYTRDASWFFDKDKNGNPIHSQPTLVHLDANGQADFAIWTNCGNVLTFTPKETPKSSLTCDSLAAQATDNTKLSYTFTAKASAQNETIQSYVFDFGDNTNQTVTTSATTATSNAHTYTQTDAEQNLTAKVSVNGSSDKNVTAGNCQVTITIPPKQQQKPTLACVSLKPDTTDNKTFTFTATAQTTGKAFTSYTFDFGDGNSQTQSGNVAQHTYANTGTYTASFTASSPDGKTVLTDACKTTVTFPAPHMTPPSGGGLVNTGPGDVLGIFSIASIAGGVFYQFILRKKIQA